MVDGWAAAKALAARGASHVLPYMIGCWNHSQQLLHPAARTPTGRVFGRVAMRARFITEPRAYVTALTSCGFLCAAGGVGMGGEGA